MRLSIVAFTHRGICLAKKIKDGFFDDGVACEVYYKSNTVQISSNDGIEKITEPLGEWVRQRFVDTHNNRLDGMVYIGACAIAVRSIAPYLEGKDKDPAVVVLDEFGEYCISLLSGHIGGGNDLTRTIASKVGAKPVITTSTDCNALFAIDSFAVKHALSIESMKLAKEVSANLIAGKQVLIKGFAVELTSYNENLVNIKTYKKEEAHCNTSFIGELKANVVAGVNETASVEVVIGLPKKGKKEQDILYLIPDLLTIGVGCKRGTESTKVEEAICYALDEICEQYDINKEYMTSLIKNVASIDLKANEEGILTFCKKHKFKFVTYSAEQLKEVEGDFTSSSFVTQITGVDNVCERSAVLGSKNGQIIYRKKAMQGVTVAVAIEKRSICIE